MGPPPPTKRVICTETLVRARDCLLRESARSTRNSSGNLFLVFSPSLSHSGCSSVVAFPELNYPRCLAMAWLLGQQLPVQPRPEWAALRSLLAAVVCSRLCRIGMSCSGMDPGKWSIELENAFGQANGLLLALYTDSETRAPLPSHVYA